MRIKYFDGLKGFSAIIVMLTHFALCFKTISWLQEVPIVGLFFDGGMAVYIFIILSAFGMCCSFSKSDFSSTIIKVALKRYFRLTMPLVLPTILAFMLLILNQDYSLNLGELEHNEWTKTLLPAEAHINQLTSGILVGVLKGSALINPLWMMKYIFLGSFIAMPCYYLIHNLKSERGKLLYLCCAGILAYSISSYYTAIFVGVGLYVFKDRIFSYRQVFLCPILLLVIILLHAYNPATTKFTRAILVVLLVSSGTLTKQLLSSSLALRINKMSYQLYLVHASVLASFCSWFCLNMGEHYIWMYLVNVLLFFCITIAIASVFTRFDVSVSKAINVFLNKLL